MQERWHKALMKVQVWMQNNVKCHANHQYLVWRLEWRPKTNMEKHVDTFMENIIHSHSTFHNGIHIYTCFLAHLRKYTHYHTMFRTITWHICRYIYILVHTHMNISKTLTHLHYTVAPSHTYTHWCTNFSHLHANLKIWLRHNNLSLWARTYYIWALNLCLT